jgi:tRNA modification GTPase
MLPDLQDTIVALSSAPGAGARAVVRLAGRKAVHIASAVFTPAVPVHPGLRRRYDGEIRLQELSSALPAELYVWPAPRTFTGQEMAELHTVSCPPLVDLLIARCLSAGARAALPGEFTMRGFLAGKLDLTRAEAVLAVIEAGSRGELKLALSQMAGGVTRPLQELREDLLNLLADVEAGLDFTEEDIHFVSQEELLTRLGRGLALVTLLGKQLRDRTTTDRSFRVVLAGRPNAGKSSLFNVLAGTRALVSATPGTTRDYLVKTVVFDGMTLELVDTAGWQEAPSGIPAQAQHLGREQAANADFVLLCREVGQDSSAGEFMAANLPPERVLEVATKCDRAPAESGLLATSAWTGRGIKQLQQLLADRARTQDCPALAPSLSRCRHHVDTCLAQLRRSHAVVLHEEPPELLALELRRALDQLGEMVGTTYSEDLLDRIFSRFCIGK